MRTTATPIVETIHLNCEVEAGIVLTDNMDQNKVNEMINIAVSTAEKNGQLADFLLTAFKSQYGTYKKSNEIKLRFIENTKSEERSALNKNNNINNNKNNNINNNINIQQQIQSNNYKIVKMKYEGVHITGKSRSVALSISDQPEDPDYDRVFPEHSLPTTTSPRKDGTGR